MKLKALIVLSLLTFMSTSAFAQFFPARVNVMVLPGRINVEVFNPYYEPIICDGQIFGQTARGFVQNMFFAQQFLPAGGFRAAFLQANPYNPFVGGWANIQCRFARGW